MKPPYALVPSVPFVPGAPEETEGIEFKTGLKEGGAPAGGGGRGGSDAWGCDDEADLGASGTFRPGGGGYDMMNDCARGL